MPETSPSAGLRVASMILVDEEVRVGIVHAGEGWTRVLPVGQRFRDLEILSADYEKETVVVSYLGEQFEYRLQYDPGSPDYRVAVQMDERTAEWKGETIESFLRTQPVVVVRDHTSLPWVEASADTPAAGMTAEDFFARHPELFHQMAEHIPRPIGMRGEEATADEGGGLEIISVPDAFVTGGFTIPDIRRLVEDDADDAVPFRGETIERLLREQREEEAVTAPSTDPAYPRLPAVPQD